MEGELPCPAAGPSPGSTQLSHAAAPPMGSARTSGHCVCAQNAGKAIPEAKLYCLRHQNINLKQTVKGQPRITDSGAGRDDAVQLRLRQKIHLEKAEVVCPDPDSTCSFPGGWPQSVAQSVVSDQRLSPGSFVSGRLESPTRHISLSGKCRRTGRLNRCVYTDRSPGCHCV